MKNVEQHNGDDDDEYNEYDEESISELLFKMATNMHDMVLRRKPHIKEYKRIRKLHSEIIESMFEYYHSGKFIQKIDDGYVPPHQVDSKKSAMNIAFITSDFDLETDVGGYAFMEITVYKCAPNINCITEDYIKRKRFRKPEKIEFLQSMLDSRAGLFEVEKTDVNDGYVHIREVFTGDQYRITDVGLSGGQRNDNVYIYTRIITYHGISFGTGLSLVFDKENAFIKDFIKREKDDYSLHGEFARFIGLYNYYVSKNGEGDRDGRRRVRR